MREILFRGKRIDNREWVEATSISKAVGSEIDEALWFIATGHDCDIYYEEPGNVTLVRAARDEEYVEYRIDPETLGQYTGLTDKNGKKIFEGDIVRMPHEYSAVERRKGYCGYDDEGYPKRIPGYNGFGEYRVTKRGTKNCPVKFRPTTGFYAEGTTFSLAGIDVEVIGNIHDNPELLGVNADG